MLNILIFLLVWNLTPILILWCLNVPTTHKRKATLNLISAGLRGLLSIIPDLTAPLVVPIALLFTKWESDKMPWLFTWWDNDLHFNGDPRKYDEQGNVIGNFEPVPLEKDVPGLKEGCYWAKGHHPRSYYARFVWMGLRNRASKCSVMLGVKYKEEDAQFWGDPNTENGHPGWLLTERGGNYQLYIIRKVWILAYRMNFGYKVWQNRGGKIMPVNITLSFKRWKKRKLKSLLNQ